MILNPKTLLRTLWSRMGILRERYSGKFYTNHTRPIKEKDITFFSQEGSRAISIAVVIQGPLLKTHDFTLETVRLYKKIFPKAMIIVSTWEDEHQPYVDKIEKEGVYVIRNKKPISPGIVHINYQLTSTAAGIKKARTLGAAYVLKTRTDQRMYSVNALRYFDAISQSFPLTIPTAQKNRLVAVSMNTFLYRPYSVSDMIMYGSIGDMERYWCIPLSEEKNMLPVVHSMVQWSRANHAEALLCCTFLKSLGHEPRFTLKDSWEVYRDHFCIIDKESIDLYWYKYDKDKEYRRVKYDQAYTDQEVTFREWLLLLRDFPITVPESIINQKIGEPIKKSAV